MTFCCTILLCSQKCRSSSRSPAWVLGPKHSGPLPLLSHEHQGLIWGQHYGYRGWSWSVQYWCVTQVPVQVPAAPLLIQLPANTQGTAVWTSSGHYGHLWRETVVKYLTLYFSNSIFQINKSFLKFILCDAVMSFWIMSIWHFAELVSSKHNFKLSVYKVFTVAIPSRATALVSLLTLQYPGLLSEKPSWTPVMLILNKHYLRSNKRLEII